MSELKTSSLPPGYKAALYRDPENNGTVTLYVGVKLGDHVVDIILEPQDGEDIEMLISQCVDKIKQRIFEGPKK